MAQQTVLHVFLAAEHGSGKSKCGEWDNKHNNKVKYLDNEE